MKRIIQLMMISLLTITSLLHLSPLVQAEDKEPIIVGMEAGYPPYNWTQFDDSNGAIQIEGSNDYANGYDLQIMKRIGEITGREVKVVKLEWEGLIPALQSGKINAIAAGMSPTEQRAEVIDFTEPYHKTHFAMMTTKDSEYANAKGIHDFEGARVTGQLSTLHYDLLDQLTGAKVLEATKTFPLMRVALESGKIDAYVTEIPEAKSAAQANDKFTYVELDPSFDVDPAEDLVAIGLKKGSPLLEEFNKALEQISQEERDQIMEDVIKFQPAAE